MIFGISHSQTFSDDGALLGARTGKGNKSMLDPSHFGTTSTIDVDCLCIEDFRRLGSRREQCKYIGFDRLPTRSASSIRLSEIPIMTAGAAAIWRAAYPMAFRTVNGVKAGERVNKWISAALAYSYD